MDCKECRDIILNDYLSREITAKLQALMDEHIKGCQACAEYCEKATALIKAPFDGLSRATVPAEVWDNIKSAIEVDGSKDRLRKDPFAAIKERFGAIIRVPRPVFAISSLILIVLLSTVLLRGTFFNINRGYLDVSTGEKNEALEFLTSQFVEFTDIEENGNGYLLEELYL